MFIINPLKRSLEKGEKIAFITSNRYGERLGDTLISLITVYNLFKQNYSIEVFGDYAYALRRWFPHFTIHPQLSIDQQEILQNYSTVIHLGHSLLSQEVETWHSHSIFLWRKPLYTSKNSIVEVQLIQCREIFNIEEPTLNNGLVVPANVCFGKYQNRVMIHPTSSKIDNQWPPKKFAQLAKILSLRGYQPYFILLPQERGSWEKNAGPGLSIPSYQNIDEVAAALCESGYFIGNDSGIGHLASNVGLPTLTIMIRFGLMRQWRPSFHCRNEVILASPRYCPRPIKELIWKKCTTVSKVIKKFEKLTDLKNLYDEKNVKMDAVLSL